MPGASHVNFSDRYRCFFIHIPKVAGTSIKTALQLPGQGHQSWQYFQQSFPQRWKNYYKFTVVRNPWDRLVSAYVYATMENSFWHSSEKGMHPDYKLLNNMSFADFCQLLMTQRASLQHESWFPQFPWITSEPGFQLQVDQVLRFENLEKDFVDLCKRIGAPQRQLPEINPSKRHPYQQYYDDETRDIVATIYHRDIELFGYEF